MSFSTCGRFIFGNYSLISSLESISSDASVWFDFRDPYETVPFPQKKMVIEQPNWKSTHLRYNTHIFSQAMHVHLFNVLVAKQNSSLHWIIKPVTDICNRINAQKTDAPYQPLTELTFFGTF